MLTSAYVMLNSMTSLSLIEHAFTVRSHVYIDDDIMFMYQQTFLRYWIGVYGANNTNDSWTVLQIDYCIIHIIHIITHALTAREAFKR